MTKFIFTLRSFGCINASKFNFNLNSITSYFMAIQFWSTILGFPLLRYVIGWNHVLFYRSTCHICHYIILLGWCIVFKCSSLTSNQGCAVCIALLVIGPQSSFHRSPCHILDLMQSEVANSGHCKILRFDRSTYFYFLAHIVCRFTPDFFSSSKLSTNEEKSQRFPVREFLWIQTFTNWILEQKSNKFVFKRWTKIRKSFINWTLGLFTNSVLDCEINYQVLSILFPLFY